jgi:hypothetical protein
MRWGFDETTRPNWLMVGVGESKMMLLDFAHGKLVKSVNPHIVEVSDHGMEGQSRKIFFEGKAIGPPTRVEVRDPQTNGLESVLEVGVKANREIGLSFNFVVDYSGHKTIHGPGIAQDLIVSLYLIYNPQTYISFSLLRAAPLELDYVFHDIVREERDVVNKNEKTGHARMDHEWRWDKIFAKNAENGFNIYFVPVDPGTDRNKNDTLVFTKGDNCIIEDGKQPPIYTLAHAIGRMLGCPFTSDINHMNHLMFWDPKLGKDFFSRSDDFIPKRAANIMNP